MSAHEPKGRGKTSHSAVYVISVVADLAGVHPQTLRMYERKGLIEPQRTAGNSRRYSDIDVDQLRRIQELTQDEGVNLAGVRIIMQMQRELERLRAEVDRTRRRLDATERALHEGAQRGQRGVLVRLSDVANMFDRKK